VEPCRSSLRGGDRIFSVEDDIYDRLIDHIYSYRFAAPEMDMEFKVSMAGKANAVIDYLVLKGANAQGELPTQLALMKLLFFVEGWSYPRAVQFCPWGARDRAKRVLDGVEVA
jgi:hypothetical protein